MGQNMSALIGSTRPFDQSSNEGIKFVLDGIRAELSEADHRVRAYLLG